MKKYIYTLFSLLSFVTYAIAQVYELPVFDRSDTPALHIKKVEFTEESTYIYCTYSAIANSWANISRESYLLDETTKRKFFLAKCDGLPFGPERKTFLNTERCDIKFSFPPIKPQGKISFIEDSEKPAFNIYGIDIFKRFEKTYLDTDVDRFYNMSSFYDSSGDSIKATQFIEKAICAAEYVYGIKSETKQLLLANASILCGKYGYYDRAIELAQQGETLYKEQGKPLDENYALNLRIIAQWYSDAGNHGKAIELYKKSINLYESLNIKDKQYAYALRFLSDEYYQIGDNDNSFFYGEKSIQVRRLLGDETDYINELRSFVKPGNNKSLVIGRLELVEDELDHLPIFIDSSSFIIAGLYKQIANTYNIIDQYNDAIKHCNKSLDILKRLGTDYIDEYVSVLSLKCKVLNYMGNRSEALSSGLMAKHIMDSLQIHTSKYAELLADLANTYSKVYDFEKSIQLQSEVCGIIEKTSGWLDIAGAYNSLGDYYKDAMDYDNAELYIKKAVDIISDHDVDQYYAEEVARTGISRSPSSYDAEKEKYYSYKLNVLTSYASILYYKKKYTDAIIAEKQCGIIFKEYNDKNLYSSHLMALGQYFLENGQYKESIDNFLESLLIANECNIDPSPSLMMLASTYYKMQDIKMAIKYANESLENSVDFNNEEVFLNSHFMLAMLLYISENYIEAEKYLSTALDSLKKTLDMAGTTNAQKQRIWDKFEHEFFLYRQIVVKIEKKDLFLSKLYDYLLFSKRFLLESDIYGEESKWNQNVSWKDIQAKLSNNDIAIEFFYTNGNDSCCLYHALVIDNKCEHPRMITLYDEADVIKRSEETDRSVRNIAFDLIWLPILEEYKDVKNIFFSLDGLLHAFAIEYHNVYGYGDLLNKYNLYRLTSTKELIRPHNENAGKNAALFGGLEYNQWNSNSEVPNSDSKLRGIAERGGFEPLFNTITEVNEVKKMLHRNNYNVTVYTGEDGTEDCFRKLSKKPLNIIHLSTHGMYVKDEEVIDRKDNNNFIFLEQIGNKNNPVKEDAVLTHSFLVLSGGNNYAIRKEVNTDEDGILTAKEISQMDLRGVDLVVLSACDSGMGDLETSGVYGLQRGFKKAGANTILMSLNKVDDEATRLLMVEFYRNLMNGKSKYQSLKDAQRYLRQVDNGKYDEPEYWASFIMLDGLD